MTRNLEDFYQGNPAMRPAAPHEGLAAGAERWAAQAGGDPFPMSRDDLSRVMVDPDRGRAIAKAYEGLPSFDEVAVPSFRAMREETGRQFEFLTGSRGRGGLGIDVSVQDEDPYAGPADLRADLQEGRMKVLSSRSTGGHPFFSNDENDMFRAVHDAFGHVGTGRGFDRHGEEAAWVSHSRMYSPQARPAMTTETRGQNSAFIFGSGGKEFQEQKVALLPEQFSNIRKSPPILGQRAKILSNQQFSLS